MGKQRSRRNKVLAGAVIAAAAIALVLVIVLSGDDESSPPVSTQPSATSTTETGKKAKEQGKKRGRGSSEKPATPGTAKQRERQLTPTIRQRVAGGGVETIRVRDGVPVDGLLRLVYEQGDRVQLRILPNRPERFVIPVLGLAERGGPPDGASFDFVATQSGLFGVELRKGSSRARVAVLVIH